MTALNIHNLLWQVAQVAPTDAWWISIVRDGGVTAVLAAALLVIWRKLLAQETQLAVERKEGRDREAQLVSEHKVEIQKLHEYYQSQAHTREAEHDSRIRDLETCSFDLAREMSVLMQQNTQTIDTLRDGLHMYQSLDELQKMVGGLRQLSPTEKKMSERKEL